MFQNQSVKFDIGGGRQVEISTGKIAKLAAGSCTVRLGDTIVLVTACSGPAREKADFFPLQVDYREKYSAAGKFPGGYIKREGRPTDKEILTCRVTDRPIRPLFPKGYFDEVLIQALLLSADGENDPDVLCIVGASAALMLSDIPFQGPIGALRVGYINGQFVANPTHEQMKQSSLELIYAGLPDKVIMIEGECSECSEELLKDALDFANNHVKVQAQAQIELAQKAGKPKKTPELHLVPDAIMDKVVKFCHGKMDSVCAIAGKEAREKALADLLAEAVQLLEYEFQDSNKDELEFHVKMAFDEIVKKNIRKAILDKGARPDGRGTRDLRPISAEVNVLPVVHGSALFTRGETQALAVITLGGVKDTQDSDTITGSGGSKKFFLHYNFPNFSVGEVGKVSAPGRREIGHGNLAERSLEKVIPADFPYTVRCVSEVMSSNGSTSMATVCGGSLALMDAGVPVKAAVAGISCGLITDDEGKSVLLTDIIGAEDHFGDMDFKMCGTRAGVTGFQLDLKLPGIPLDLLFSAMLQIKETRMKILDIMDSCIPKARPEVNERAPRIAVIKINPSKIGAVIGPGGKNIKEITETTGAEIDIQDDGSVTVLAKNGQVFEEVKARILAITAEAEVGKIYRGRVVSVKEFGAFVELFPGTEGLLHISEMANYRVGKVEDICREGDFVSVKVIDIDRGGKIRLSRKAALEELDQQK